MKIKNLAGKIMGNWAVLQREGSNRRRAAWLCKCICGKEKVRLGQDLLRGKNTGCGCKSRSKNRPYEALFNLLKRTAGERCVLSYEEFLEFTKQPKCHYCKAFLNWKPYYANKNGYKLDRVDPKGLYSRNNCVVCCARCNQAKSDHFTYDEWKSIGRLIQTWEK